MTNNAGVPMSSMQLEQQFQARIAQAKEAARLASIAAAVRGLNASSSKPLQSPAVATPGVPFCPPSTSLLRHHSSTRVSDDFYPIETVPPEVKQRIDRLVEFVARNGDAFEAIARHREQNNPDFAFLRPNGPFSNYYQWKKQQICQKSVTGFAPPLPVRASSTVSHGAPSTLLLSTDPLGAMAVGAMANVCKYARASDVQTYAPIPRHVIMNVGKLPSVEPARLEIRLSEFYRHEKNSN